MIPLTNAPWLISCDLGRASKWSRIDWLTGLHACSGLMISAAQLSIMLHDDCKCRVYNGNIDFDPNADSGCSSCFSALAVSYRLKFVWMEACTSPSKSVSWTSVKRRGQVCDRSLNRHASALDAKIRSAVASCITSRESNSLMMMWTSSRQMIYYISLSTVSDLASNTITLHTRASHRKKREWSPSLSEKAL